MRLTIIAGEESGDLLGGALVKALKKIDYDMVIDGIGGTQMQCAGMTTLFNISDTAVMGIVEIIRHYPRLRHILHTIQNHIIEKNPDLLILIDYPEFNLKLAKTAAKHNIPVVYYVSPQIWAWRKGRIRNIKRCVHLMVVLFPFELDFYREHDINAVLARHPLATSIPHARPVIRDLSVHSEILIALLPGSRSSEVRRIFPALLKSAQALRKKYVKAKFIIPIAPSLSRTVFDEIIDTPPEYIHFTQQDVAGACSSCDLAVVASGTATLQMAMLGIPMLIVYKMASLTYVLLRPFVKIKCFGLANIVLGEKIFTELLQSNVSADNICQEIDRLLRSRTERLKLSNCREIIHEKLRHGLNADELATRVSDMAKSRSNA